MTDLGLSLQFFVYLCNLTKNQSFFKLKIVLLKSVGSHLS